MDPYPPVRLAARSGTLAQFLAVYRPGDATWRAATDGRTLLFESLRNTDLSARLAISTRLLDDGADPTATDVRGMGLVYVIVSGMSHDFRAEAPLLQRLLDGGADVNRRPWDHHYFSPLVTLASQLAYTDDEMAPFHDVLLARRDLRLELAASGGRGALEAVAAWGPERAVLLRRLEAYDREHRPLTLGDRAFHGERNRPAPVYPWPEDGYHLWDEDPQQQFYVAHDGGISRCGPDLRDVLARARTEIWPGYDVLLGYQKVAVARPDGTVTRWVPVPHVPLATPMEDRVTGVRSARGYQLHPYELVKDGVFAERFRPHYPVGAEALDEAVRDATALADVAAHPVVVGLQLVHEMWH